METNRKELLKSNSLWRHFKGGDYQVLCIANSTETPENEYVVYRGVKDGKCWSRPLGMFLERVYPDMSTEEVKERFEYIGNLL